MKKIFTWGNFSVKFLKAVIYSSKTSNKYRPNFEINDADMLAPYMDEICAYPDEKFVRKYRNEIENYFLANSNSLVNICRKLEKINYHGVIVCENVVSGNQEMLESLKCLRFTSTMLQCYISELRYFGKMMINNTDSVFIEPKTIDLSVSQNIKINLFDYQENAVNAMKKFYFDDNNNSGILVMPTGSGKTRTSIYFLLKEMVSKGYQVVWLAHRSMLIEQAANNFYKFSPLIKLENEYMEDFKMVCISGNHSTVKSLEKDDNVIISSIQSLCNNTVYLPNILNDKVIIVVDEAHHTLAPSYRRIIRKIREKASEVKLLGLTATPVRLTDLATQSLMKIYDDNIIFSVTMSDLIANKTLSNPVYTPRLTNIDIEAIIDIDERKFIEKYGEMPESLLKKVAETNKRNDIIVNEYVKNKEKYGKTIIFALNGIHCITLNDMFRKKGIKSDYIYSLNNDNDEKIYKFKNGEIDVLININILTEGSDIPEIQTVFLTRPTSSDTLLMQMVGRGMRGIACGGTEDVNIVDFCDKWSSITKWLNPKFLFEDDEVLFEENTYESANKKEIIPIALIRDMVKQIRYTNCTVNEESPVLPIGWYEVIDDDGNDVKVLVFESQLKGYINLHKDIQMYNENSDITGKDLIDKYFNYFGLIPNDYDIEYILNYYIEEGSFPVLQHFKERDEIEPFKVAKELKELSGEYKDLIERISNIYHNHKEIIDNLYGSGEYYRGRIVDCILYPNGLVPVGSKIEEVEKNFYNLSSEPIDRDINELLDEVIKEQRDNFPDNFIRPEINWTDKNYSSYFGEYYHKQRKIFINLLLNSKDIPIEVIKFVIYHECLHQEYYGHPKEFRQKEHLYPNFQEHENFLDYKLQDYNIEYAI